MGADTEPFQIVILIIATLITSAVRCCAKTFRVLSHLILTLTHESGFITIPMFQMRKLRLREISHTLNIT